MTPRVNVPDNKQKTDGSVKEEQRPTFVNMILYRPAPREIG